MSLSALIANITLFFQNNLVISIAIIALLLYLLFRKPRLLFLILFIAAILAGVFVLSAYLAPRGKIPM